jgi:hypothetical protein
MINGLQQSLQDKNKIHSKIVAEEIPSLKCIKLYICYKKTSKMLDLKKNEYMVVN